MFAESVTCFVPHNQVFILVACCPPIRPANARVKYNLSAVSVEDCDECDDVAFVPLCYWSEVRITVAVDSTNPISSRSHNKRLT